MRILDILFTALGGAALAGGYMLFSSAGTGSGAAAARGAPQAPRLPVVEVARAERADAPASLRQTALLRAASEVTVTSELAGRVVWINEGFELGQRLPAGAPLFRLDTARLDTDVARARADVSAAAAEQERLDKELARISALAERNISTQATLATTTANLAAARATLAQRRASLTAAEIARSQAEVRAPFDAVVSQESLSLGQFLQPGNDVGRLVAATRAELLVRLTAEQLQAIEAGGPLEGRAVVVRATDGSGAQKPGRVERVALTSEATTQTTALLVVIDDPFARDGGVFRINALFEVAVPLPPDSAPLLTVPVSAVQAGNRVWAVQEGALTERAAGIERRENDRIVLRSDEIEAGAAVVTTRLPNAVEGLKVRVVETVVETEAGQ